MAPRNYDDWADEDDGEFPVRGSSNRGRGLLVSAAVLSFIMSAFNAILASIFFLCGSLLGLLGMADGGNFLPPAALRDRAAVTLILAFFSGVSFLAQIFAGVGLVRERPWSRTLAICLAVYALLAAGFFGYAVVQWLSAGDPENESWIALAAVLIFFHLGYAIPTLVLLNTTPAIHRLRRNALDD